MNLSKTREELIYEAQERIGDLYQQMEAETDQQKKDGLYGQVKSEVATIKHNSAMLGVEQISSKPKLGHSNLNDPSSVDQDVLYQEDGSYSNFDKEQKKNNTDVVSASVRFSCETLVVSIDVLSESIRGDNHFRANHPKRYTEITEFLIELKKQSEVLVELLPNEDGVRDSTIQNLEEWYRNTGINLHHQMKSYFTPTYIGENASPLIIVGIFTSVCAGLSSALGFGAPTTAAVVGGISAASYVGKGKSIVKEIE